MPSISGNLTGKGESAVFTPTNSVSEIVLKNSGAGAVQLISTAPGVGDTVVASFDENTNVPISTSDTGITYKFKTINAGAAWKYYMGA